MTFEEWHKANAKYMEPADFYPWLADAFAAGAAAERERMGRMLRAEGWLQCATMVEGRSE